MKIFITLINVFIIIVLYFILIKKITKKIYRKIYYDIFKIQTILSPITILYSIVLASFLKINIKEMGFQIGDYKNGLISIFAFGFPIFILAYLFAKIVKKEEISELRYVKFKSKWQLIYVWIFVGLTEETFFRGLIQTYIDKNITGSIFTISYSVILTSFIFSVFHILNVKNKGETLKIFIQLFPTRFVISVILGYSFQISYSLIYPIIIHNLIDGITFTTLKNNIDI